MIAYSEVGGTSKFAYSVLAYDGYGDDPVPPPGPVTCTYTISPTGKTFKASGGAGSFAVSTQSGFHLRRRCQVNPGGTCSEGHWFPAKQIRACHQTKGSNQQAHQKLTSVCGHACPG